MATLDHPAAANDGGPSPHPSGAPLGASSISYIEAQRLMALDRAQGPDALTPAQHHAIWDCLLARPESPQWLTAQLEALQGELQERGLTPWEDGCAAR